MASSNMIPRILAGCLAIGGLYWSAMLWPFLFDGEDDLKVRALELQLNPLAVLIFGPGYLATAACILRTALTPSLGIRRTIWVLSLAVQGTWLTGHIVSAVSSHDPMHQLGRPFGIVAWLATATLASAAGLVLERQPVVDSDCESSGGMVATH
jgi:hypothetical protein